MQTRPILFKNELVEKILNGEKTMTRRLIKLDGFEDYPHRLDYCKFDEFAKEYIFENAAGFTIRKKSPYGMRGDQLYIRESFWKSKIHGMASFENKERKELWEKKPGIHMPKEFSRATLLIENVYPERLLEISKKDAEKEGMKESKPWDNSDGNIHTALEQFERTWKRINGPLSWFGNPWVWVIEFKVI